MNELLVNIVCLFILKKKNKKHFREKYGNKIDNKIDKIILMLNKIDGLNNINKNEINNKIDKIILMLNKTYKLDNIDNKLNYIINYIQSSLEINPHIVFKNINEKNSWGSKESISGSGSELKNTETLRKELPNIINKYNIKSMIDCPCGDMNWMAKVDLSNIKYYGFDIVEKLIEENKEKLKLYTNMIFECKNIINSQLPSVDLIFCRDLIIHFPLKEIIKLLNNFVNSNSKYLLITQFDNCKSNDNIDFGQYASRNLTKKPFNFPEGILSINDKDWDWKNKEFSENARMTLYKLEDIKEYLKSSTLI
jgi:hypothetical protein